MFSNETQDAMNPGQWSPNTLPNPAQQPKPDLPSGPGVGSLQPCKPLAEHYKPWNPATGKFGGDQ
jgi:hypothetical protein